MTLSRGRVEAGVTAFCHMYPSAYALKYRIRDTEKELYETRPEKPGNILGAYYAGRGLVALAASNFRNDQELLDTLRHEIIGHFGLNTFEPEHKRGLLTAITAGHTEPGLSQLWRQVDQHYPQQSPSSRAEEVFAYAAEETSLRPAPPRVLESAKHRLTQVLEAPERGLTYPSLIAVVTVVAAGMASGERRQKTFPADHEQFQIRELDPVAAHAENVPSSRARARR